MKKNGKVNSVVLFFSLFIIILLTIILLMGIYIFNHNKKFDNKINSFNEEKIDLKNQINEKDKKIQEIDENVNKQIAESNKYKSLIIKEENIVTKDGKPNEYNYLLIDTNSYCYLSANNNSNSVGISFNVENLKNLFPKNNINEKSQTYRINCSKKVQSIYICGFGHASDGDTIFVILEDGSIEYIKISDIVYGKNLNVKKIDELKEIVLIDKVFAGHKKGQGGFITNIAISKDGKCYDLNNYIEKN